MSNQGDGQQPPEPGPEDGQSSGAQPQPGQSGGHRLPGSTGGQPVPGQSGRQPQGQPPQGKHPQGQHPQGKHPQGPQPQQGDGGQWTGGQQWQTGGQQPWATGGQQPWASGGQESQPPSWSTGQTGPNVGPTMNNPQSSYYDQFSAASGEGVVVPGDGGGKGGRGKVLIGLAAALVLVIAAVAAYAFTRSSDAPKKAAASSSQLPPVTATTWVNPTMAAGSRALKPGWQSQQADDSRGVYDVPKNADWLLKSSDTLEGYADPVTGKPLVVTKAPAEFGAGFCAADKNQESGWLGLVNIGTRDPTDAGPDVAQKFADAIAVKKDGSSAAEGKLSAAKQIKVDQGTIPALEYTITTAVGDPAECDKGKTYEVRTVTFSAGGKSYQLVSIRMLGVSKELPSATLDEIFTTFRPS